MSNKIRTTDELHDEWGIERYVNAIAALANWYEKKGFPIEVDELRQLHNESEDAFTVHASRVFHAEIPQSSTEVLK